MGLSAIAFATIEHDPYVSPVRELPAKLIVAVEAAPSHYEDEHVPADTIAIRGAAGFRHLPVMFPPAGG